MFKHILLPTDGSPLSEAAVEKGIDFAKSMHAKDHWPLRGAERLSLRIMTQRSREASRSRPKRNARRTRRFTSLC